MTMFDWNGLLAESSFAAVMTADYARFARSVRDALVLFLSGLPEVRQAEIFAGQMALPAEASIGERLAAIARLCPVLHKLGQVLARDQRLAPSLRRHLRTLESLRPSVSALTILEAVERELGPLESLGIRLCPPAIAEASVAIVVPYVELNDRGGGLPRDGVLKVLKPAVMERLEMELELLTKVGARLDERCEGLQIPRLDYEELFEQIRDKLRHEVRLDEEQLNLTQAAKVYATEPRVHIPALRDYCTPRITAMERIHGRKVGECGQTAKFDRRGVAESIARALIAQPIFSPAADALFHADPHAGNLLLTEANRLAILDWSLVGSLGRHERAAMVQIMMAAAAQRPERIVTVLQSLCNGGEPDPMALCAVAEASVKRFRQGQMPGLTWLTATLDDAVQKAGLRTHADILLFRKSLFTLEGVIAEVGGGTASADQVLMLEFFRQFICEWPQRCLAPPRSRNFATRLSNYDLLEATFDLPAAAARFWIAGGLDLLDSCLPTDKLRVNFASLCERKGAGCHVAIG